MRVDSYPTHRYGDFKLRIGNPTPFGATLVASGVQFSVFSRHARNCTLVLFCKRDPKPYAEIPFPDEFRIGNVFTMIVFDLDIENIEYGFRMDGPNDPHQGHRFDCSKILLDPYAKTVMGRDVWSMPLSESDYKYRARVTCTDFDWGPDRPLEIPLEDIVVYEMHVRGMTRDPSSAVRHPGTFAGVREKIPYLKELGVNCVELMPVFEFDEQEDERTNPTNGQKLLNYWGYNTVGFFAPKAGFAATGKLGMQVDEFKTLVRELHKNGIEVWLDVVFNHTAEGDDRGPTISFRGIDNQTFYMLNSSGQYMNFSGCGNTINCNNPIVREMVLDCLRYWAAEFHIDGFRFDLASILGRDPWGFPMACPPLLENLAFDPILAKCKLVAEAWDAGGLYQVGSFPAFGRWAEWNGQYRDIVRKFLRGDCGLVGAVMESLCGSPQLYGQRDTTTSINFITCHDGMTLMDLFSYDHKHNDANGWNNSDGNDQNFSWNCGHEGDTDNSGIVNLRRRQAKNAAAMLLVSQGVPMILMGDEFGRTQQGNNNAYCQDNEISWMDWKLREKNDELFRFFRNCIAFRKAHTSLRSAKHLDERDIAWHGVEPYRPDLSSFSRSIAMTLNGRFSGKEDNQDDPIYFAANMADMCLEFKLPVPPENLKWHLFANTSMTAPEDVYDVGAEPPLSNQNSFQVGSRSIVILVAR